MAINETLKFSWGHIVAFVAMIFISYVSFMGMIYLTDGDFLFAGLGIVVINLAIILFFILPQILKGTERKFKRRVIWERVLVFAAPIAFVVVMSPYAHFWNVFENRRQVEELFSQSVKTSKGMFVAYEEYANNRLAAYEQKLAHDKVRPVYRSNATEALRLQILADNYVALKESAIEWIDRASGATVWNAFMLGNIKKVEDAIESWNHSLNTFSSKIMADEPAGVESFSSSDPSVIQANDTLKELREVYTVRGGVNMLGIGVGVLLYLLLMFPYFLQGRNTKSMVRLVGSEEHPVLWRKKSQDGCEEDGDMSFRLDDAPSSREGDYESFTM